MESKLLALLKSRKFWAALLGVVGVFLVDVFAVPEELAGQIIDAIMALVAAYILGTALEDGLRG